MSRGVRKQIEGHDVKNPFGLSGATTFIILAECEEEFLGFKMTAYVKKCFSVRAHDAYGKL